MSSTDSQLTKELAGKIHQFLSKQIESNAELSEAAKESLTVASECIEQAYGVESRQASNELLDIYRSHKQQSTATPGHQSSAGQPNLNALGADPIQLIQSLASSFLGSAAATPSAPPQAPPTATQASASSTQTTTSTAPPKTRKRATEAEKLAAESFKNQGNDFMKLDKYKEAYDCYTQAISIDDNNAVYYSNRAAASGKLGDHQAALRDCEEAIEIDSTYSKAYGRMGLAYASLNNPQKAIEAYSKALELDPTNEGYRNNLNVARDTLSAGPNAGATTTGDAQQGAGANLGNVLQSMFGNPEVMQMAFRSLQDPRFQNLLSGLRGGQGATADQTASAATDAGAQRTQSADTSRPEPTPTDTSAQQQQASSQPAQAGGVGADLFNLTSRLAGSQGANIDLLGASQQILSTFEQSNPGLMNNLRQMMGQSFMPPNNNSNNNNNANDRDPPPGYS